MFLKVNLRSRAAKKEKKYGQKANTNDQYSENIVNSCVVHMILVVTKNDSSTESFNKYYLIPRCHLMNFYMGFPMEQRQDSAKFFFIFAKNQLNFGGYVFSYRPTKECLLDFWFKKNVTLWYNFYSIFYLPADYITWY